MDGLLADRLFNPLKPDRHFYVSPGLAPAEAEASVGRGILAGDCSGTPANPTDSRRAARDHGENPLAQIKE
jgi:hypothetical protein